MIEQGLDFSDVLIRPKWSALPSRNFVLERQFSIKHTGKHWKGVPLIASNMDHTGTVNMANTLYEYGCMTALHKFHSNEVLEREFESSNRKYKWFTIGMNDADLRKLRSLFFHDVDINLCIDVANGHTTQFHDFVQRARIEFPNAFIMAGNVASAEATQALLLSGADMVKVGIGSGSVCTTRIKTGVGVPQLSAIMECKEVAHGMSGLICADGGCTTPADVCKAFGAGADFVMLGGMLAGHDECDGSFVLDDGSVVEREHSKAVVSSLHIHGDMNVAGMEFYGMSSQDAQERYYDGVAAYRAVEGKKVVVPYRGSVRGTIKDILGSIRSCMTYIGAQKMKHIEKCTTFIRVNNQSNEIFGKNDVG